jgi:hypothetical protein
MLCSNFCPIICCVQMLLSIFLWIWKSNTRFLKGWVMSEGAEWLLVFKKDSAPWSFYFLLSWSEAINDLLYQPRMMIGDDEYGSFGEMLGRWNWSARRKPAPVPLRPPQILRNPIRARAWTAAALPHHGVTDSSTVLEAVGFPLIQSECMFSLLTNHNVMKT